MRLGPPALLLRHRWFGLLMLALTGTYFNWYHYVEHAAELVPETTPRYTLR